MPFGRLTAVLYLTSLVAEVVGMCLTGVGLRAHSGPSVIIGVTALVLGCLCCDVVLRIVNRRRALTLPLEQQPVLLTPSYEARRVPAYAGVYALDAWRAVTSRG